MKPKPYETEAALCAAFLAWVKAEGERGRGMAWTPYAETAGWDILLVAADGTQIGIQAKQRFNLKVLSQCLPERWEHWHDNGPDFRAILVPEADRSAEDLCAALGLLLFRPRPAYGFDDGARFAPTLDMEHSTDWHYWSPRVRCKLPAYVPDVVAGASGPVQLTPWKVSALRIVARIEVRGHVTRADFRELQVDPRRWTGPGGWIVPVDGKPGCFARGAGLDFDQQHPTVYAQVLADTRADFEAGRVPT